MFLRVQMIKAIKVANQGSVRLKVIDLITAHNNSTDASNGCRQLAGDY